MNVRAALDHRFNDIGRITGRCPHKNRAGLFNVPRIAVKSQNVHAIHLFGLFSPGDNEDVFGKKFGRNRPR